ncbi:hypothetical protein BJV78DRAFT_920736 [Lactifluus subvellereus]|nr:hypothetical protein BJV78DRAFT_920736 [Lactifluus subvellereus]
MLPSMTRTLSIHRCESVTLSRATVIWCGSFRGHDLTLLFSKKKRGFFLCISENARGKPTLGHDDVVPATCVPSLPTPQMMSSSAPAVLLYLVLLPRGTAVSHQTAPRTQVSDLSHLGSSHVGEHDSADCQRPSARGNQFQTQPRPKLRTPATSSTSSHTDTNSMQSATLNLLARAPPRSRLTSPSLPQPP